MIRSPNRPESAPRIPTARRRQLLGLAVASLSHALGLAAPSPDIRVVHDEPDLARWAALGNFGYTDDEIKRFFATPVAMPLDESGLDRSWIKPPPPAGVHPRVLFNPEDLPALRKRLATTRAGQVLMPAIRAHLAKQLAPAAPASGSAPAFADYPALVAGRDQAPIPDTLAYSLLYEAFRCLVDEDTAGGERLAAALVTLSRQVARDLEAARAKAGPAPLDLTTSASTASPLYDGRTVAQAASREYTLGLAYDFAHPFMTGPQRDAVRDVLARATAGLTVLGGDSLPARPVGASYWNVWAGRALFALAAIEGEAGHDPAAQERVARSVTRYVQALFPSGDSFEAWGKNYLSLELLVLLAKRRPEWNLAAHAHVRAGFRNYLPAALLPWGGGFTFADSLGRSGALMARTSDAMIYRALYPSDPYGDLILREQLREDPRQLGGNFVNTRHFLAVYDALLCAIFATDFDPLPAEKARAAAGLPLSWFCEDGGNLITRSAWRSDALYLAYQNRSVAGGHPVADRSHFSLYSHRRVWSLYQFTRDVPAQAAPDLRSVILADGQGPSVAEARCIDYQETPGFTLVASDLRDPWAWQSDRLVKAPAGAALYAKTRSYNELRLHPSPLPWMDLPIGDLPDWYTSQKSSAATPGVGAHRRDWYRRHEVRHAFRSVALIRGPRPYAFVFDDLQLDEQPHDYRWGMIVPPDVAIVSQNLLAPAPAAQAEILLGETGPVAPPSQPAAKARRLLVLVLDAAALDAPAARIETLTFPNGTQPPLLVNRLHFGGRTTAARFQILLYPHEEGDPLPQIRRGPEQGLFSVNFPDQSHSWLISTDNQGRTRLSPREP